MDDRDPDPWEQQPGEPDNAYRAFTIWRDLTSDERSHARVRSDLAALGIKTGADTVSKWSARFTWAARGRAWLGETDRRNRQRQLEIIDQMAERHARGAAVQLQALNLPGLAIDAKMRELRENGIDPIKELAQVDFAPLLGMTVAAARVYPGMADVERLSRLQNQTSARPPDLDQPQLADRPDEPTMEERTAAIFAFAEEELGLTMAPQPLQIEAPSAPKRRVVRKSKGDA